LNDLKLAVIGAGSTYTPELVDGVIRRFDDLPVRNLALMDIDEDRLAVVGNLARRMVEASGKPVRVVLTRDRRAAISGADFVITQMRVGGMRARILDEKIPLEFGVIGQETTGPGGFANALRTIPVVLELCREVDELAPDAWVINFANPSGLVTQAALKHGREKVIGMCNGPIGITRRIAGILGCRPELAEGHPELVEGRLVLDYFGLNHLNWIRGVTLDGVDRMDDAIEGLVKDADPQDAAVVRDLRMIPCAYLKYYYRRDSVLQELKSADKTRGEAVSEIETDLLAMYADESLTRKPPMLEKRGGAFYSEAALSLIADIHHDRGTTHIISVRNNGSIDKLAGDAVVEVPCTVDRRGATPHGVETPPPSVSGLLSAVKSYEELAAEAAVTGDRRIALLALLAHPLVPSHRIAELLLARILEAHAEYLPRFGRK